MKGKPLERKCRKWRRPEETSLSDDPFSRELSNQGEDGKLMRLLYLNPWIKTYRHRIEDESLQD